MMDFVDLDTLKFRLLPDNNNAFEILCRLIGDGFGGYEPTTETILLVWRITDPEELWSHFLYVISHEFIHRILTKFINRATSILFDGLRPLEDWLWQGDD